MNSYRLTKTRIVGEFKLLRFQKYDKTLTIGSETRLSSYIGIAYL